MGKKETVVCLAVHTCGHGERDHCPDDRGAGNGQSSGNVRVEQPLQWRRTGKACRAKSWAVQVFVIIGGITSRLVQLLRLAICAWRPSTAERSDRWVPRLLVFKDRAPTIVDNFPVLSSPPPQPTSPPLFSFHLPPPSPIQCCWALGESGCESFKTEWINPGFGDVFTLTQP